MKFGLIGLVSVWADKLARVIDGKVEYINVNPELRFAVPSNEKWEALLTAKGAPVGPTALKHHQWFNVIGTANQRWMQGVPEDVDVYTTDELTALGVRMMGEQA